MNSFLAGICISLGCCVYLSVGGIAGALLFSVGLLAILDQKLDLFTGKAGALAKKEITWLRIGEIWFGNFLGTACVSFPLALTPVGVELAYKAQEIVQKQIELGILPNVVMGIGCGILMYLAVSATRPVLTIAAVATFILCGFSHCVALMFYCNLGMASPIELWPLIPVTIGNLIGCNIIPWLKEE